MRALVIVVAVLAALWSGWWAIGSRGVAAGLRAGAEEARADGWTLAWDDLAVRGFPNRFDTTVTAPRVAPPDGAWAWTAPFVQVFALSYRPNHVIAVAPPTQKLDLGGDTVEIASEDLRASLVVAPGPALALREARLTGEGLSLAGFGEAVAVGGLRVAMRATGEADDYEIALGLANVTPPGALRARVSADLPAEIGAVELDAVAALDAPVDRHMAGPPGVAALELRRAELRWGAVRITAAGTLRPDAAGRAEGEIAVTLADPEALLDAVAPSVPPERLAFARSFLAGFPPGPDGEGAVLTLRVSQGVMAFGPFPLVALPPFRAP